MNLQEQILGAINTTLKNPIYQTLQLLNIKSILKSVNAYDPTVTVKVEQAITDTL